MSAAVNIITNMTRFDESRNTPIGQLGRFHGPNNNPDVANGKMEKTYEQGLKDGYAQAEGQMQSRADLGKALVQNLMEIKTEIETGHRHVVATLLQTALPALSQKHMTAEITDFVMSLATCALEGQVILSAHPEFEVTLKQVVQSIDGADGADGADAPRPTFIIKTDAQISGRAVRATWQGGGGVIDLESTIEKLLTRIEQV